MGQRRKYPSPVVSLTEHPASLPEADISDTVNHEKIATSGLELLSRLCETDLTDNAIWRDSLALTGTLRTFFRPGAVIEAWEELSSKKQPKNFAIIPNSSHVTRLGPKTSWIEARFSFDIHGEKANSARPDRFEQLRRGRIQFRPGNSDKKQLPDLLLDG